MRLLEAETHKNPWNLLQTNYLSHALNSEKTVQDKVEMKPHRKYVFRILLKASNFFWGENRNNLFFFHTYLNYDHRQKFVLGTTGVCSWINRAICSFLAPLCHKLPEGARIYKTKIYYIIQEILLVARIWINRYTSRN